VDHARVLLERGADFLDIGAAASGPRAGSVSTEDELARLRPVLVALEASAALISIDSANVDVQRYAIGAGVAYLNDVAGFAEPEIYEEIAHSNVKLVVVHTMTGGRAMVRQTASGEAMASAHRFFAERLARLTSAGVDERRIVLDPGMGLFLGAGATPSVEVLRGVAELKRAYGLPVMISVSRKSFLGDLTGRKLQDRAAATLAAEIFAVDQGADYIRTHDPGALHDAFAVLGQLRGSKVDLD
jgi:dihydropteroate synthase